MYRKGWCLGRMYGGGGAGAEEKKLVCVEVVVNMKNI
jgi:hypothetical protein